MLEVRDLHVDYGGIAALKGVSLSVRQGEMVALIGSNGAGKTTLLNTISGFLTPAGGAVAFAGESLARTPPNRIARRGLLHVPEGRQILAPLTVEENLELGMLALGDRKGDPEEDFERVYEMFPVLRERRRQEGGSLSGGEQQMLAIGRALMGHPRLLLLDEPSLGLSPLVTQQVFGALKTLNAQGLTILLVEQNARRALAISNRTYVIEQGRIVQKGESRVLSTDSDIAAHYLGGRRNVETTLQQ